MELAMNVDPALIKKKREEKSWSQEHLATVSGLSLRTVQRVEADGSASADTRMAIASAFGIERLDLMPKQTAKRATPGQITCSRITGALLALGGALLFLVCFVLVLRANSPDVARYLRLAVGIAAGSFQNAATALGLLGIVQSLTGILVFARSRHAFSFCVVSILCTLSLYLAAVLFIPLRPTWSDILLFLPTILLAGIAARCSYRKSFADAPQRKPLPSRG